MRNTLLRFAVLFAGLALNGPLAAKAPSPYDPEAALAYSQAAIGRQVGDFRFRNRQGDAVTLADWRGQPTVVNLLYTGCTQSCPLVLQSLHTAVLAARDALGPDRFGVLSIGLETPRDTPAQMRAYASAQGIAVPGWRFLSADADTVRRLAADLGFVYYPSPKGFDHIAQVSILDAEGRVYQQVYGDDFAPPAVVEPLKQLVLGTGGTGGTLSGLIERVRLFCTLYDPAAGRYRFDYSLFIALTIGGLSLTAIATVLVRAIWRSFHPQAGA